MRRSLVALALGGVAAVAWLGCGREAAPEVASYPDDYGIEVSLQVVGGGRVFSPFGVLDCPGRCFEKLRFPPADAPPGGIVAPLPDGGTQARELLRASAGPGSTFLGWTFRTHAVGTRGPGPDTCNPIVRSGSIPPAPERGSWRIDLPFGSVLGAPPVGREEECAAATRVPVLYDVVASFTPAPGPPVEEPPPPPPDPTLAFLPSSPTENRTRGLGFVNRNLYWFSLDDSGGTSRLVRDRPDLGTLPRVPETVRVFDGEPTQLDIGPGGVAFQTTTGAMFAYVARVAAVRTLQPPPEPCRAFTIELFTVTCRTEHFLLRWVTSDADVGVPYTYVGGVPPGNGLAMASTNGRFLLATESGIVATYGQVQHDGDGGIVDAGGVPALALEPVVPTPLASRGLVAGDGRLWWFEGSNRVRSAVGDLPGAAVLQAAPVAGNLSFLALDPEPSRAWVGNGHAIVRIDLPVDGEPVALPVHAPPAEHSGIAVDEQWIYTTTSFDGLVRRRGTHTIAPPP